MSPKQYFSYVRVSTVRQGQRGTSLKEQRDAIQRYARKSGLNIVREFQELETAARRGRPIFQQMMQALHDGRVAGLVMHKIDRGARNLKDWAEIGELIDSGVEIHFANENLDMYTRGGRLSADIQAVVAADYIRNLREEVKKGIYGRLKQGFYPMRAPTGYRDMGGGQPKAIDLIKGPMVKQIFDLYSTHRYGLHALVKQAKSMGLRNRSGRFLSINGMSTMLHNHFYTGIIRLKTTEEYFEGRHEPLVSKELFDRVQVILKDKTARHPKKNRLAEAFIFRKYIICSVCNSRMTAERHKIYSYYRCHTQSCTQKPIREVIAMEAFLEALKSIKLDRLQSARYETWLQQKRNELGGRIEAKKTLIREKLGEIKRAVDGLGDELIRFLQDKTEFICYKNQLVEEDLKLRQELNNLEYNEHNAFHELEEAFEFAPQALLTFTRAPYKRKREVLEKISEPFVTNSRIVTVKLRPAYQSLIENKE